MLGAALNYWHGSLVDELLDDGRLSDRQIVTVLNMSRERATDLLRRMINGAAFGRADRESRGVFDTVNGEEIVRRLDRGGGSVATAAAVLGGRHQHLIADEPRRREVGGRVRDLKAAVGRFRRALARACPGRDRPAAAAVELPAPTRSRRRPGRPGDPSFAQVVGNLKQCVYFLDKSSRDLTSMGTTAHPLPTPAERQKIRHRLKLIAADVDALRRICADRP